MSGLTFADLVIRAVAELPDRDSPADQPEMMLVTADELRAIINRELGYTFGPQGRRRVPDRKTTGGCLPRCRCAKCDRERSVLRGDSPE
jgi:hypothetical protein